jgi:hypothetical protein
MVALMDLWLPIVVSAAAVWVASALAWMVMPHHKNEFQRLPNEDTILAALRAGNIPPGQYMFPYCDHSGKHKDDPQAKARMDAGPWGLLHAWPQSAMTGMGGKMLGSLVFYVVTSVFVAYVATLSLTRGSEFLNIFQITGTAAIMAYAFGSIPHAIWFNTPMRSVIAGAADGIVYGLLTGIAFGLLWPGV